MRVLQHKDLYQDLCQGCSFTIQRLVFLFGGMERFGKMPPELPSNMQLAAITEEKVQTLEAAPFLADVVPSKEQIDRLQAEMSLMPQVELQTEHYFSGGMYCRKLTRPAGTLIVGKVHKEPHFFMCTKGEIIAWSETGMRKLSPGDIIESKPGTKRVTLALSDAIGITIHKTDKTDLDEIETELIEPDETALFDSGNNVKQWVLEAQKVLKGN